ncbi:uncharacterized protein LOC123551294 [Mercenaria mercenaria]|uniref:uncharacterized protein LOC123551294 n=1 Tax=Mercenaria mercenaria TaxID=6596 RepID=UPI00234F54FA|nr:uncharacterized protein LOC123551294 [Mercenaria mercenaria]
MAELSKVDDNAIQYFQNFLCDERNKKLMSMLRGVLSEFGLGLARSSVFFLRVNASNANSYSCFKKASVDTELHRKDSRPLVAPLCLFFLRGYATLVDFLDKCNPKIPDDLAERQALRELLQLLSNANELSVLVENKGEQKTESEVTLATRLAQHLLVPLVPDKTVVVDSDQHLHFASCCSVGHSVSCEKGDTSFGCPRGWHGQADVLFPDDKVSLSVVAPPEDDAVSVTSDSSLEIKKGENFTTESVSQVVAQTVMCSFVQQRKNPTQPCALVPGIGICSEKLIVYLYDCVEDILLTTGPLDLYAQMGLFGLNPRAIIILWLILNHKLFSNKTPERYKGYMANFHHVLGPVQLEAYKNESEQPFRARPGEEEDILKIFNEEHVSFEDDLTEERRIQFPERRSVSLN